MSRRILVEVTEEELNALNNLNKEKTLTMEDIINELAKILTNTKPDVADEFLNDMGEKVYYKKYSFEGIIVYVTIDMNNTVNIKIENRANYHA